VVSCEAEVSGLCSAEMEFEMGEGAFDDIGCFSSGCIFSALPFGEWLIAIRTMKDAALVAKQ